MRRTAVKLTLVCSLLWLAAGSLAETVLTAGAGIRPRDLDLQKIDQALRNARENKEAAERLVRQIVKDVQRTKSKLSANRVGVVAKSSSGVTVPFPDTCKTPDPPSAPVPIPYPNIGMASDGSNGSKRSRLGGKLVMTQGHYSASAATADENGTRLIEFLRVVRSEVEIRHDFVAGICRKCRLSKADARLLQRWLSSAKKDVQEQMAQFSLYVRHIEQIRRSYLQHVKRR